MRSRCSPRRGPPARSAPRSWSTEASSRGSRGTVDGSAFRRGSVAAGPDEPGLVGEDDELLGHLLVGESERARSTFRR
jgi:hypothetical protein